MAKKSRKFPKILDFSLDRGTILVSPRAVLKGLGLVLSLPKPFRRRSLGVKCPHLINVQYAKARVRFTLAKG